MRWILLDVALALVALSVLAVLVLRLWRRVQSLGVAVTDAGERIARATDALSDAQGEGPLAPAVVDDRASGGGPADGARGGRPAQVTPAGRRRGLA